MTEPADNTTTEELTPVPTEEIDEKEVKARAQDRANGRTPSDDEDAEEDADEEEAEDAEDEEEDSPQAERAPAGRADAAPRRARRRAERTRKGSGFPIAPLAFGALLLVGAGALVWWLNGQDDAPLSGTTPARYPPGTPGAWLGDGGGY